MKTVFRRLFSLPLFLFFIFILHLPYIPNGFTWLDHGDIERGRTIVAVNKLPDVFFTRFGDTGFYRPVVTILNSLDAALYGLFAPGFHLTNLFLHIAVTATIPYFLMTFLSISRNRALMAALVFGIHPLTFLPVGAISYRPELLMTLFVLLTAVLHIKVRETGSITYTVLTAAAFLLALWSKETALFLIPAMISFWELNEWFFRTKKHSGKKKKILQLFIVEVLVVVLYFLLRSHAVPEFWRVEGLNVSLFDAIGTRLYIVGKLLLILFTPVTPSLSDAVPVVSLFHAYSLLTLCAIILSILLALKRNHAGILFITLLLLLLFLAPALNIIPVPRLGSPHYTYSALVPFSLLLVLLISSITARYSGKKYLIYAFCMVWMVTACMQTFIAGFRFKNDETLFKPEVTRDNRFSEGYFYLGNYYLANKKYSVAEQMYSTALQPQVGFHAYVEPLSVMTNLGAVYYAQHKYMKADRILQEAQAVAPPEQQADILYNRALFAHEQKNYQKVVDLLTGKHTNNPLTMLLLADALHNLNRDKEAINILQQSLPLWPQEKRPEIQSLIQTLSAE
jgi:protein O-mannosyl-transferase